MEGAWRVLAIGLVLGALWGVLRGPTRDPERVEGVVLPAILPSLTRAPARAPLEISFDAAPPAEIRDWLAAVAHAGTGVAWQATRPIPTLALEVVPRSDPAGGVRALVAAAPHDRALLADAAGPLDTLRLASPVAGVRLPAFVPPLAALAGGQRARAAPHDSLAPRRVVVLGGADWEGKFVLAALEERGWAAAARFTVAPGISVVQSGALSLDTAQFAAAVVLDSAAAGRAASVVEFVRQGGGVVLAGDAARNPRLAALAPGVAGPRVRPTSLAFTDSAPRRALGFFAITALRPDAIPLESRGAHVSIAARRAGAGRVLQLGYDETWRWRFAGGPRAPEAHRAWWAELVASVAHRSPVALPSASSLNRDAAPLAQLISALGPSAERRAPRPALPLPGLQWWVLALTLSALLAETASRRTRGAP